MNKKRAFVIAVLGVFVLVLVLSQRFFDNNFKQVALSDNNISTLKEVGVKDLGYTYSMPDTWSLTENKSNSYKLYRCEFKSEENNIMGYIEVLSTKEDVKALGQKDLDNVSLDTSNNRIENYSSNKYKGIKVDYLSKVQSGYSFVNSVYYLRINDDEVLKFFFTSKKGTYKDNINVIYDVIISSFKVK